MQEIRFTQCSRITSYSIQQITAEAVDTNRLSVILSIADILYTCKYE